MKKITTLVFLALSFAVFGQSTPTLDAKQQRINKIYRNLEYNTTSFNDLKQTWIVTDPVFVREVFNKFVVHNSLKISGKKPTVKELEEKAEYIYNGDVFIDLRRRFYDDEIEIVRFFKEGRNSVDSTDYYFDAVHDYVSIREILGDKTYNELKSQAYALNDITKSFMDYKPAYNFSIYLSLLEPEVMFWSATTNNRNKYLLSAMGRWGNDRIGLPGWYSSDYIIGLKVAYEDSLVNNKQSISYSGEIGLGVPAKQPDLGTDPTFVRRKLLHSGTPLYMNFVSKPFKPVWEEIADMELQVKASFTLGVDRASDYHFAARDSFYSTRNYFDIFLRQSNISRLSDFGNFYAGFGVSAFDIKSYLYVPPIQTLSVVNNTDKNGFKFAINTEAGLQNEGTVLTHNLGISLNYNLSEKLILFGVKFNFLVSNTLGFDFRVVSPIMAGAKVLPGYRSDTYMVFSPIFRINY